MTKTVPSQLSMLLKRVTDGALAIVGMCIACPLAPFLVAGTLLSVGWPIYFRQTRVGRGERALMLLKLRTMRNDYDAKGVLLPDGERVTRYGSVLRRYRLDELPELWLILRGEMSWVGPRPLPRSALVEHGALEWRSAVRPGLTGLAQVSGNTLLSNTEKFAIDRLYIDTATTSTDLSILAKTFWVVLTGETRDERTIARALDHAKHFDRNGGQH